MAMCTNAILGVGAMITESGSRVRLEPDLVGTG